MYVEKKPQGGELDLGSVYVRVYVRVCVCDMWFTSAEKNVLMGELEKRKNLKTIKLEVEKKKRSSNTYFYFMKTRTETCSSPKCCHINNQCKHLL